MLIADTDTLRRFCAPLHDAARVGVDTEFLREKTYYPTLCLVQVASGEHSVAVDALASGIDLSPLWSLLADPGVVKVLHSASQDIEILAGAMGEPPAPVFDTQVAAAFCGYGEQPGYATLAERIAGARIDKASQMTDWSRRPLTERQLAYALSDVEHLGAVHAHLVADLERRGRTGWADEEMAAAARSAAREVDPREQWRRIRVRRPTRRTLAVLRELAAWREESAQRRDLPRGWVVKDDALVEIAANRPRDAKALERVRGLGARLASGKDGQAVLEAVRRGAALPESECPALPAPPPPGGHETLVALMQALLRTRCEEEGVAPGLVASRAELDRIATEPDPDVRPLRGWRRTLFGEDALALRAGRIALTGSASGVAIVGR